MIPGIAVLNSLQTLLADDSTTIAPASSACKVALVIAPFTPSVDLVVSSLTLATFTGSDPLSAGTGNQQSFYDPTTGSRVVQIKAPAGGWHWQATGATGLPQNVYGFVFLDNAGSVVYGSDLLPTPVTIAAIGDGVDIVSEIRFTFTQPTLS